MMINDVIRDAKDEHEIYFLLASYLDVMQFGDKKNFVSEATIALPLRGTEDLRRRFHQLLLDLDNASKSLDDHSCLILKEALQVFGCALHRLHHFEESMLDRKSAVDRSPAALVTLPSRAAYRSNSDANRSLRL